MKKPTKRGASLWLLGLSMGAVALLAVQNSGAMVPVPVSKIAHLCLGPLDLNLQRSPGTGGVFVEEGDAVSFRECTFAPYAFESVLPGKRYLVAATQNRGQAVLGYVSAEAAQPLLQQAVGRLEAAGLTRITGKDTPDRTLDYALLLGDDEELQVMVTEMPKNMRMLWVIHSEGQKRRVMYE